MKQLIPKTVHFSSKILSLAGLLLFLLIGRAAYTQDINQQNFSNLKVDQLSDDQIRQFMTRVQATGLSEAQLEQVALARGMAPSEVQKLKLRVEKLRTAEQNKTGGQQKGEEYLTDQRKLSNEEMPSNAGTEKSGLEKTDLSSKPKIFGADLFRNANLTFEPNLRIPTPKNYQIGPDDQIVIDIYGYSEANYKLTVSPEGSINIPYVGLVYVNGLTIEAAGQKIKSRLATVYAGIKTGNTFVQVSIGNIRSIKVTLLGEIVKPGTYTLPSLATVFNALYASGGPTENGSFREIEVIRNNQLIRQLDVYDFLMRGDQTNNIRLQDQDIIRVPTYRVRVELSGEVKRPGLYEILPNEHLNDAIQFAGGFTDKAYTARIKVLQNTDKERKISDVVAEQFNTYVPLRGDQFFVEPILNRFQNRVSIQGAVFRPGQYELEPGLTLRQLIKKAEGLREDAFRSRGNITRLNPDLSTELLSFDVEAIMKGTAPDISLQREDVVNIASIFDLREEYKVSISGEVQYPGEFPYADSMSLEDLIVKAGGLKESATNRTIEVARRVKNSDPTSPSAKTAQIFRLNVDKDLKLRASQFTLRPFDIVIVRGAPGYEVQQQVMIQGEVLYPGAYTMSKKDERISDILNRAGGLTALAFPEGASLKRTKKMEGISEEEKLAKLSRLQSTVKDTLHVDLQNPALRNDYVAINLEKILQEPGSKYDLYVEEGDVINIPKQLQTVKVSGEVLYPVTAPYFRGRRFKYYISQAGGFSGRAKQGRSYVVYANGYVRSTRKIFFFNHYPRLKPGAEIFVPRQPERKQLSTQELIGITTGVGSLAAIVLGILNFVRTIK